MRITDEHLVRLVASLCDPRKIYDAGTADLARDLREERSRSRALSGAEAAAKLEVAALRKLLQEGLELTNPLAPGVEQQLHEWRVRVLRAAGRTL